MKSDLERAFDALKGKRADYDLLWKYYDGDQPLKYSTQRLKETFRSINVRFTENWCSTVVETIQERLVLKGLSLADKSRKKRLNEIWMENDISLEASDALEAMLVCGEAFILCWKDEAGMDVYFNDPRMCHVFCDPEKPKVKTLAAKWWAGDNGIHYLTLYYPDRLEYYATESESETWPDEYGAFKPYSPEGSGGSSVENTYGVVPVFQLRTTRRGNGSILKNVTPLQDAINKLLADMMISAEFGAWKQRYVISNSSTKNLKNAPNEIWSIPAGDGISQGTSVGEFSETNLDNFLKAIDDLANRVATLTRIPKQYLFSIGSEVSGDALIAMEAPLVKKAEHLQEVLEEPWQELGALMLTMDGMATEKEEILPIWEPPASQQPFTEIQEIQMGVAAGIPLVSMLRRKGWTEEQINQVLKDQEEEKKRTKTTAQALLNSLRLEDGNANPAYPPQQQPTPNPSLKGGEMDGNQGGRSTEMRDGQ